MYKSLLLVDDDVDDHEIFSTALENVYPLVSLTTSENGVDAFRKLSEQPSLPEIIFLDINMPVMNGLQFLTEIKKNEDLKKIPVIIYTTTSAPETITLARQLGANHFISKPENFSHLEVLLKETLNTTY